MTESTENRLDGGLECRHLLMTPDMAAGMLARNAGNRKLRPMVVRRYADDMAAGRWLDDGASIRVGRDGNLLDGQHRLAACVEAGVPFPTLVVYNVDEACRLNMDTGATRSLGDHLRFLGYQNTENLATVVRFDAKWNLIGPSAPFEPNGTATQLTRSRIVDWFDAHADGIRDACAAGSRIADRNGGLLSRAAAAVFWLNLHRIDAEDADAFLGAFASGAGLEPGDPILVLRDTLTRMRDEGKRGRRTAALVRAAVTVKAWNRWRAGETCTRLYWNAGGSKKEAFPAIDGWEYAKAA